MIDLDIFPESQCFTKRLELSKILLVILLKADSVITYNIMLRIFIIEFEVYLLRRKQNLLA